MRSKTSEAALRKNALEERRKTYLAIENIVAARPRGVDEGARVNEIMQYTQLPFMAIASAMKFLKAFAVIHQDGYQQWRPAGLPNGFCWKHGTTRLMFGECQLCKETNDEDTQG
jgi:hypothetical protein